MPVRHTSNVCMCKYMLYISVLCFLMKISGCIPRSETADEGHTFHFPVNRKINASKRDILKLHLGQTPSVGKVAESVI